MGFCLLQYKGTSHGFNAGLTGEYSAPSLCLAVEMRSSASPARGWLKARLQWQHGDTEALCRLKNLLQAAPALQNVKVISIPSWTSTKPQDTSLQPGSLRPNPRRGCGTRIKPRDSQASGGWDGSMKLTAARKHLTWGLFVTHSLTHFLLKAPSMSISPSQ